MIVTERRWSSKDMAWLVPWTVTLTIHSEMSRNRHGDSTFRSRRETFDASSTILMKTSWSLFRLVRDQYQHLQEKKCGTFTFCTEKPATVTLTPKIGLSFTFHVNVRNMKPSQRILRFSTTYQEHIRLKYDLWDRGVYHDALSAIE